MSHQEKPDSPAPVSPSSVRPLRWLLLFFVAVIAAPSVLTVSGQTTAVLRLISPELARVVSFESMTAHWWSPVSIDQLVLNDAAAEPETPDARPPIATVRRITTTEPLWKIALAMGRGTELNVESPVVNVWVSDGQTNIERSLQRLTVSKASDGGPAFPVIVNLQDGIVRLLSSDPAAKPLPSVQSEVAVSTTISGINGRLSTLNATSIPEILLEANVGATQAQDITTQQRTQQGINPRIAARLDEFAGDFPLLPFSAAEMSELSSGEGDHAIRIQVVPAENRPDTQQITIEARRLDLSDAEPLLERFAPNLVCRGQVSCRFQGRIIGKHGLDGVAGRLHLLGEQLYIRDINWTAGEALHFDNLTAQGAGAMAEDGVLLNHLNVSSALLDMDGNGEVRRLSANSDDEPTQTNSTSQVRLNGRINLAALSAMLPQTLSISPDVKVRSADLKFSARIEQEPADAAAQQLMVTPRGFQWQVAVESSAIDAQKGDRSIQVDSSLRLDAVGNVAVDHLSVRQARMTGTFGTITANPFEGGYEISGQVNAERLWTNLNQITDLPRPGIDGDVDVSGKLSLLPDGFRMADLKLKSASLTAESPALSFHQNRPALEMLQGQLTVQGYGRAVKTVVAAWHDASWLSDSTTVAARLIAEPGQSIAITAVVNPTQNAARSTAVSTFQVSKARVDASIAVDALNNGFIIQHGTLRLPGLDATLSGTLNTVDDVLLSDLNVDLQYDLESVTAQLLNDPQRSIRLTGTGRENFTITGAPGLWTATDVARHKSRSTAPTDVTDRITPLAVAGTISWQGGEVYRLPLGPGKVVAELQNGVLRTQPIQCSLGTGTISAMPQWDLTANLLQLASGSRIENLQITPQLASEWLGYVAPLVGDSANASGSMSCRVVQFDHYFNQPRLSNIQAVLTIHNAAAAPGPSLTPLLQVVELVSKKSIASHQLEFPPQDVPFEMRDGMVRHQDLRFGIADYEMVSSGGVGIDRRIQLSLDVPIERSSPESRGRSIRLAVGGSVDRPQIDTGSLLQSLGQQQLQNQLGNQLDRGLNKLFDKLR